MTTTSARTLEWTAEDCATITDAPRVPQPSTGTWMQPCLAPHPTRPVVCMRMPGHGGRHHARMLRDLVFTCPCGDVHVVPAGTVVAVWGSAS